MRQAQDMVGKLMNLLPPHAISGPEEFPRPEGS